MKISKNQDLGWGQMIVLFPMFVMIYFGALLSLMIAFLGSYVIDTSASVADRIFAVFQGRVVVPRPLMTAHYSQQIANLWRGTWAQVFDFKEHKEEEAREPPKGPIWSVLLVVVVGTFLLLYIPALSEWFKWFLTEYLVNAFAEFSWPLALFTAICGGGALAGFVMACVRQRWSTLVLVLLAALTTWAAVSPTSYAAAADDIVATASLDRADPQRAEDAAHNEAVSSTVTSRNNGQNEAEIEALQSRTESLGREVQRISLELKKATVQKSRFKAMLDTRTRLNEDLEERLKKSREHASLLTSKLSIAKGELQHALDENMVLRKQLKRVRRDQESDTTNRKQTNQSSELELLVAKRELKRALQQEELLQEKVTRLRRLYRDSKPRRFTIYAGRVYRDPITGASIRATGIRKNEANFYVELANGRRIKLTAELGSAFVFKADGADWVFSLEGVARNNRSVTAEIDFKRS